MPGAEGKVGEMSDLTKLTAEEFRDTQTRFPATTVWDELWRRAERLEKSEAAFARVEKANMPCRKHKPLRSPLCRQCQLDGRIEEARAALEE